MGAEWQTVIPPVRGTLPGGAPLRRTDPSGPTPARVAFVGIYPALTHKKMLTVGGKRMWLPTHVEAQSFAAGSASGGEIDEHYLAPLGLTRADTFITDLMPYFFANTTRGTSGRSMADNVAAYEDETGETTGIEPRPPAADLVELGRSLPGNLDRLRSYLGACKPEVLFTLGTESAAFVRGISYNDASAQVDELLYAGAERLDVLGASPVVVHLVHPHLFIKKNEKWMSRHRAWCEGVGRRLVLC